MPDSPRSAFELIDQHPPLSDLHAEALAGLRRAQKALPPKLFYDQKGSELFVEITRLPEYYPTRVEIGIMEKNVTEMVSFIQDHAVLVDLGSGASRKARILLDETKSRVTYMPLDISLDHLEKSARAVSEDYPNLRVVAVCSDYTTALDIPRWDDYAQRVLFFPGSTIGNFEPAEAKQFISYLAGRLTTNDGMLIGVDLEKDISIVEAAYDDSLGVTAEFNRNILRRINRELGADFDPESFEHVAFYNKEHHRIEMHLRSVRDQAFHIGEDQIEFKESETIHTENSYKYSVERFRRIVEGTGFSIVQTWTDPDQMFSVHYLVDELA